MKSKILQCKIYTNSKMSIIKKLFFCLQLSSVLVYHVNSLPIAKSSPDPDPNPQYPLVNPSRSSQQFTMYKPIQLDYQSYGTGTRQGQLFPIFNYNYNISHPSNNQDPLSLSRHFGSSQTNGIVLSQNQIQYLQQRSGQPLSLQHQRQYSQNANYAPVIITNPNLITKPNKLPLQRHGATAEFIDAYSETEPEPGEIGLRLNTKSGKTSGRIVFNSLAPGTQQFNRALQYPENIYFSNNQNVVPQAIQLPYTGPSTTPKPIQVPYITTPSTLTQIKQLQNNNPQAGFRSQLGLVNPLTYQQSEFIRNSGGIRTGRVQNIVVPLSSVGQTPAGTRLLQENIQGQEFQNLRNRVANTVYAHQYSQGPFAPVPLNGQQQRSFGLDFTNPSLHILRGLAITPENQREAGHIIFNDPRIPSLTNSNIHGNAVLASSAQKIFILPQDNGLGSTDSENSINFEETPAEIVVTVVDETESDGSGKGKVLTNFSLLLLPSTTKKCAEGHKRAHDGKCRLVIKLRGRTRTYT